MMFMVAAALMASGAVDLWVESPLTRVYAESFPLESAQREVRLHAACGERESAQLCIRGDGEAVADISVETGTVGKHIPPPTLHRVGYLRIERASRRAQREGTLWPDPLLEFEKFSLEKDTTAAIWLTYDIPRDATPGTFQGKLVVHFGKHAKRVVKVSIEVFPFILPETPTPHTAFTLNRKAIRSIFGIDDAGLDAWKPFYDTLARERISYRVWDGGGLVPIDRDGMADTTRLKEHLAYAAESAHFNSIDIGAGPTGIVPFPVPPPQKLQDPLQFYLHDMCNWLDEHAWLPKAYIEVMPLPDRTHWQLARDAYFRVQRNDKRIHRLLAGAGDPFFERYADIWAMPLRHFDPYCDTLLRQGKSLTLTQTCPAEAVSARTSGSLPGDTLRESRAEDAYDACLFTYWVSHGIPRSGEPQWLQINLKDPITTSSIRILWKNGFEAKELDIERYLNDHFSTMSHVKWTPHPPTSPFTSSWLEGSFAEPETFQIIRFEFRSTFFNGPVGVTEIVLDEKSDKEPAESIQPMSTWLCAANGDFPSFAVDAHPVEARMFPWVCWGHRSEGFMAGSLNHWPAAWVQQSVAQPLVWRCHNAGEDFLYYPGRTGLLPSIRSEALRDGMEDYEYLAALDQAITEGRVQARDAAPLCVRNLFAPDLAPQQLDALAHMIERDRVHIGWALAKPKGDVRR